MATSDRMIDLLVQWEELRRQGKDATPEELCPDDGELREELRRRMRNRERLQAIFDLPTRSDAEAATPEPTLPATTGYEILAGLGRGCTGVVYQARHAQLHRLVVLKMILSGTHAGPRELARFRQEAEAVARLQHPNIVQIYEVGEWEGRPFLALEYVEGGSLAQAVARGQWPVGSVEAARNAAQLVESLARAIHYAHEQGIIHRDLKPANILLSGVRNQASGVRSQESGGEARSLLTPDSWLLTPKIADFGLAKLLAGAADGAPLFEPTQTGTILGSPSYMAPEQAAGQVRAIGRATDIYALGAIFYELLTGRPPFLGDSLLDTLEQVRTQEPNPPRTWQSSVPRDLETICLKCLQKDPAHRYPTAEALADDLRRFLQGELIQARSFTIMDRLARTLNRSQHFEQFKAMSAFVGWIAAVPLGAHALAFGLTYPKPFFPATMLATTLGCFLGILVLFFWLNRRGRYLPQSTFTVQFWSLRIAHALGMVLVPLVCWQIASPGQPWELAVYPFWTVLTGVIFFGLGGSYWGRLFVIGSVFFIAAALLPLRLEWAPLVFTALVSSMMLIISLHLRRLAASD